MERENEGVGGAGGVGGKKVTEKENKKKKYYLIFTKLFNRIRAKDFPKMKSTNFPWDFDKVFKKI